jgi:CRP-like cAMP-binding protein
MASKKTPLQHLANVPLFSSCNARDLGKIAKASERVTLKAGTTMITQGTAGKQAYVILSGTATVKRNGKKIATAQAGTMVGELSLLAPRRLCVTPSARCSFSNSASCSRSSTKSRPSATSCSRPSPPASATSIAPTTADA